MLSAEYIPPLSSPHRLLKEKMSSESPIIGDIFAIKTDHFPRLNPPPLLGCWGGGGGGGGEIYIDWCINLKATFLSPRTSDCRRGTGLKTVFV
jgi:hypothetical protein